MKYKRIKTAGIYALKHGPFIYIGSSQDVSARIASHLWALRRGTHKIKTLQSAYTKTRRIEILRVAECYPHERLILERQYIEMYRKNVKFYVLNKTLPKQKKSLEILKHWRNA